MKIETAYLQPSELGEIRDGARMQQMLPYVKAEVEKSMRAIENTVLSDMQAGRFNAEIAYQRWIEWTANKRLLQRFEQTVRVGQSVGVSAGNALDLSA